MQAKGACQCLAFLSSKQTMVTVRVGNILTDQYGAIGAFLEVYSRKGMHDVDAVKCLTSRATPLK